MTYLRSLLARIRLWLLTWRGIPRIAALEAELAQARAAAAAAEAEGGKLRERADAAEQALEPVAAYARKLHRSIERGCLKCRHDVLLEAGHAYEVNGHKKVPLTSIRDAYENCAHRECPLWRVRLREAPAA